MLSKIQFASATLALVQSAGQCPFGYTSSRKLSASLDAQNPSQLFTCPSNSATSAIRTLDSFSPQDYEGIVSEVLARYAELAADSSGAEKRFAGCVVRFAGHDFMDFRRDDAGVTSGGSDGCVNFADPDNKGLAECLDEFGVPALYEKVCGGVSLADFTVILAEAIMGRTSTLYNANDYYGEGTLARKFRDNFKAGRETSEQCSGQTGLMPNPEEGCAGLSNIFVDHIYEDTGMPWTMTAAISGAHTLGSAKQENSGYEGSWSDPDQQGTFNNDYYKSLLLKGWSPQLAVNGDPLKNQWARVDAGRVEGENQFMLNTDLCMLFEHSRYGECMRATGNNGKFCKKELVKAEPLLAHEADGCCAWHNNQGLYKWGVLDKGEPADFCGREITQPNKNINRKQCCKFDPARLDKDKSTKVNDCDKPSIPQGLAQRPIKKFAADEDEWLDAFFLAWKFANENGHKDLFFIDTDAGEDVEPFDCSQYIRKVQCQKNYQCQWVGPKNFNPEAVQAEKQERKAAKKKAREERMKAQREARRKNKRGKGRKLEEDEAIRNTCQPI